jgi:hypothetical protein
MPAVLEVVEDVEHPVLDQQSRRRKNNTVKRV